MPSSFSHAEDPDMCDGETNGLSEAELADAVGASCLIPVLESLLSNASFTDMSRR